MIEKITLKKYVQLLIGVLISVFFIYLTLPSLHLPDVVRSIRTAHYIWLVPGVAVYFVGLWARTWRWHYTLRHLKEVPLKRLFPLICIGYFGNNVYPFRAGEVIRSYVLKRQEEIAISSSLATVLIERVFDGLVMLLFVFIALPFAPMPAEFRELVIVLTTFMIVATAVFIWMAVQPQRVIAVYTWCADRILPVRVRVHTDELYVRFMRRPA